jgi:hypothetical protein
MGRLRRIVYVIVIMRNMMTVEVGGDQTTLCFPSIHEKIPRNKRYIKYGPQRMISRLFFNPTIKSPCINEETALVDPQPGQCSPVLK